MLNRARAVCDRALQVAEDRRQSFVRRECGTDEQLIELVMGILSEYRETIAEPVQAQSAPMPDHIGPFRIVRILGRGGMGTVYEAEQHNPRRPVALKVIDSAVPRRELIARFEHESAVLARLQHPGIAQIYDAGSVPSDHGPIPYFAMELIRGVPLNRFVEERNLGTRDRLGLVAKICEAVQHAHQKGVIHRDLKPANILVDANGEPKILDFGVARLTESDIQTTSLRTDIGQLIGTIPYMSPEQVSGDPGDLDTRSDVYAIGVLMYELLAGRLPYSLDRKMIHEAARIIREEEPTRLSSINRTLRGDVETIAAKALDKDKTRRYQSATELAGDIRRYLTDQPISARPPSVGYQLKKFSRRNKGLVSGIVAAFLALSAGLGGTLWQWRQAREQRDTARSRADELAQVSGFQAAMLSNLDVTQAGVRLARDLKERHAKLFTEPGAIGASATKDFELELNRINATDAAASLIDESILVPAVQAVQSQFQSQPAVRARLLQALATLYRHIGRYAASLPLQEEALAIRTSLGEESLLESQTEFGILQLALGNQADADRLLTGVVESLGRANATDKPIYADALANLAAVRAAGDNLAEAERLYDQSLKARNLPPDQYDQSAIRAATALGVIYRNTGRAHQAEQLYRICLERAKIICGPDNVVTLQLISNLGVAILEQNRILEAEPYYMSSLELRRRVYGENHPETLIALNNVGFLLERKQDWAGAERHYREAADRREKTLTAEHPQTLNSKINLASILAQSGRPAEAEELATSVLAIRRRILPPQHRGIAQCASVRARARLEQKKYDLAQADFSTALSIFEKNPRGLERIIVQTRLRRAQCLNAVEQFSDAETELLRAELETQGLAADVSLRSECIRALENLYKAWHNVAPTEGYDARSKEWHERLPTMPSPPNPATPKPGN